MYDIVNSFVFGCSSIPVTRPVLGTSGRSSWDVIIEFLSEVFISAQKLVSGLPKRLVFRRYKIRNAFFYHLINYFARWKPCSITKKLDSLGQYNTLHIFLFKEDLTPSRGYGRSIKEGI